MQVRRAFLRGVIVLAILVAGVAAFLLFRAWSETHRLGQLVTELDRTEPGWRLEDRTKPPLIPEEQNSATVLRKARLPAGRKIVVDFDEFKLLPNQTLTAAQVEQLRAYREEVAESLIEARKLTDFPEGRFAVIIAPDVISTLIPHAQDVREVARALHLDMAWQAQHGNFDQALANMHAARNASRVLKDEVFLISLVVRLAVLNESAGMLERLIGQGQPPPEQLLRAQELLQNEIVTEVWFDALAGERALMHELFTQIERGKVPLKNLRSMIGVGRREWTEIVADQFIDLSVVAAHRWLLDQLSAMMATHDLAPKERRAKLHDLDAKVAKAPHLAKLLMPSTKRAYDSVVRVQAKLAAAQTGLAVERFRAKHGRWPKQLDELVPGFLAKVLEDPCDGEPLRFRATKDGVVIYSVGPEGDFTGAGRDHPDALHANPHGDYEFRLWNVDQRRKPGRDP
jgi:hypothetical protein